ncbi:SpoIIE family protein phosphatase [Streptomyces sp. H10-C2]|uniref:SpoIIE family protein phosphatase n=1 Tax=unclassified Streptomyces TaxID=2593676 RepID=UPI0024BAFCA8|nr:MULTISPECIES: SpoIIE family protein phosphatase [unclassified Streptomyces]MDJ0343998.1 SpoIIE family protein phosphatase [Streptomyces sp. PH10-H1]MDJ0373511.1 SpoIIE family protein phosphatase [Streptomyces sp. H10-C2]
MHPDADADSNVVLRGILEGTSAGVGILDPGLRYVYVNPALARINGVPAEEHLGRTIAEVLPGIDGREDVLRAVLADGLPREVTSSGHTQVPSGLERRYWHGAYNRLEAEGVVIGIVGIVLEVTASRQQQRDLEQARERLVLLDAAATRIGTTLETDATCGELADFLVPLLADVASVEVLPVAPGEGGRRPPPPGVLRMRRTALSSVPALSERVQMFGVPGEYVDYQAGSAITRCLESGKPLKQNLLSDEELVRSAPSAERVAAYRAAGIHSALVVPLAARGHPIGTVSLVRAGDSPAFTDEDVVVAQDLAGRAAISLDNARRFTREHDIALGLQSALLAEPSSPHPNIEVAFRYLPAGTSALVGGDWYDAVQLPGGRTLLAMGDVMGHGVEAAVDMSHYRAMLRVVAADDHPPHHILERLDALIAGTGAGRPATCLLVLMDPVRGVCSYASAGHLPPAVFGPDGHVGLIRIPTGPPLGTGFGGYQLVKGRCTPGWVLLLYTDGLVERRGEDIDQSLARLAALRLPSDGNLDDLLDLVLERLVEQAVEDDVAVLAARVLTGQEQPSV